MKSFQGTLTMSGISAKLCVFLDMMAKSEYCTRMIRVKKKGEFLHILTEENHITNYHYWLKNIYIHSLGTSSLRTFRSGRAVRLTHTGRGNIFRLLTSIG